MSAISPAITFQSWQAERERLHRELRHKVVAMRIAVEKSEIGRLGHVVDDVLGRIQEWENYGSLKGWLG